jgi:hypothetical protein
MAGWLQRHESGSIMFIRTHCIPGRREAHRMDSNDLRRWQVQKIRRALERTLGYLTRLKRRMEVVGFPTNDPLFLDVVKTQHAMQDLVMELHYLGCQSGVGKKPRGER